MVATIQLDEYNGVGETKTANPTDVDMGSVDSANLDPVANPIVAGENSYEKVHTLEVTAMGGSSEVKNIKIWRTGALGGSATHLTNARESAYVEQATYVQPVATASTIATQTMPSTEPTGANLGIAGVLTGALTAVGETDRLYHQIQTDAGDTAGSTSTMNFQYDEVA